MIFSELYSAYYNAVARILREAVSHPVTTEEMRRIIAENAFDESALAILPALSESRWPLLRKDGTTPLHAAPTMPLTKLQKEWIHAISQDPRMLLFLKGTEMAETGEDGDADAETHEATVPLPYPDEKVLFAKEDYCVFDRYADGDPYEDPAYRAHFATVLEALREKKALRLEVRNRYGHLMQITTLPSHLEYSEKDDKFRLFGRASHRSDIINLARIDSCELCEVEPWMTERKQTRPHQDQVVFDLLDERKALDRVMLHFAHFERRAEKLDEKNYRVTLLYDRNDETEMVIRLLGFGPLVRVREPEHFVDLMRERLLKQQALDQGTLDQQAMERSEAE